MDDRGQFAVAEGLFYQLIVRLYKYSLGRNNYEKSIHCPISGCDKWQNIDRLLNKLMSIQVAQNQD